MRHHHLHKVKPKRANVALVAQFPGLDLVDGDHHSEKHKNGLLARFSPLMMPETPSFGIAVNGIKTKTSQLYFTNTNWSILARIPIEEDGTSKASAKVVAHTEGLDDFTIK
ncbi:hypothetical protein MMC29_006742 [Sticta canariensis]|nr:hypothetical protein [Sticta canariensis]